MASDGDWMALGVQVRAWTRGWDLFAPDEHLVFHKWERGHRKGTFWEVPGGAELKRRAQARVRRLLTGRPLCPPEEAEDSHQDLHQGSLADDDGGSDAAAAASAAASATKRIEESLASAPEPSALVWGVGHVRSLRWYEAFSGVDFAKMRVSPQAERGGMPDEACFWDRFACIDAWLEARPVAKPERGREGDRTESERRECERDCASGESAFRSSA